VFHAGAVRILDVQIPPGDVTLYHTHATAILYVPISISLTDSQILGQEWLGVAPGSRSRFEGLVVATDTSYATKSLTHRVKNVGNSLFRLIAVTNAAMPEALAPGAPPGKSVHASRWYNAAELTVASKASSDWQVAGAPTVVVLPGAGQVRVERDRENTPLVAPGAWGYIETGQRYRITNQSIGAAIVVLIQANL
jgi:quercetin dioxygenase-like cupin family protein